MSRLKKEQVEDVLELTSLQQGMLFEYLSNPRATSYTEQLYIEVAGNVDYEVFARSWDEVTKNNQMLRTCFRWEGLSNPVQIVLHVYSTAIQVIEARDDDHVELIKQMDKSTRFDLENVAFRVTLIRQSAQKYGILITNHHILYDGWSNSVIVQSFFTCYDKLKNGLSINLTPKTSFKEHLKLLKSQDEKIEEKFWQDYLAGYDSNLLTGDASAGSNEQSSAKYEYILEQALVNDLNEYSKANGITLATICYGAWALLLRKLIGSDDILFGTTASGRSVNINEIENLVGLFINVIPLRVAIDRNQKTTDFLKTLDQNLKSRKAHELNALSNIKKYSNNQHLNPLFDTLVTMENYPLEAHTGSVLGDLEIKGFSAEENTNYALDLGVSIYEGIRLDLLWSPRLFQEYVISALMNGYVNTLKHLILDAPIHQLEIVSPDQRKQLLQSFGQNKVDYPNPPTLLGPINRNANNFANNTALVFKSQKISYGELKEKYDQVAACLQTKQQDKLEVVGIYMETGIDRIVTMLGVLNAGAAYLPIGIGLPKDRLDFMLKDSNINRLIVSRAQLTSRPELYNPNNYELIVYEEVFEHKRINSSIPANTNEIAYVMYTSGSTGNPKGVVVKQSSVLNLIAWFNNEYKVTKTSRISHVTDYTFDPSVEDIFGTLTAGGTLYIIPEEMVIDISAMRSYFETNKLELINFVPTVLKDFLLSGPKIDALKTVISGGEKLDEPTKNSIIDLGYTLYNNYGPTEQTVDALYDKCEIDRPVSLGRPVANNQCLILDIDQKICPIGVFGEIHLAGVGLTPGYLNRPKLNKLSFPINPFDSAKRMFKTGDMGRWLPDGRVEFGDRRDFQVKIRGHRIELGEIEHALLRITDIYKAVVLAKKNQFQENYLVAFISYKNGKQRDFSSIKKDLAKSIPEYMIPDQCIELDQIPLTSNGKVDRKKLKKMPVASQYKEQQTVQNHLNKYEHQVEKIWRELLMKDTIDTSDNFFEVGGNSLLLIRLVEKIKKEFKAEIPATVFFQHTTIAAQAKYIKENKQPKQAPPTISVHDRKPESNKTKDRLKTLKRQRNAS